LLPLIAQVFDSDGESGHKLIGKDLAILYELRSAETNISASNLQPVNRIFIEPELKEQV
jgi:hypothetical protein